MLRLASVLTALALSGAVVRADQAMTSPNNGTSVSAGSSVNVQWYSDDKFDSSVWHLALVNLVQLGEFSPSTGSDGNKYIKENITIPSGLPNGTYFMGITGLSSCDIGNNTGRTLDDYDFKNGVPNQTNDQYIIVNIGSNSSSSSSSSSSNSRRDLAPVKRDGVDELVYSPGNFSVSGNGAYSFNFTYRLDGGGDGACDVTQKVAVSLARFYDNVTISNLPSGGDDVTYFNGTFTVPSNFPDGYYYIATPKDSDFNSSTWSNVPDNYDKAFKSSETTSGGKAQISGNSRGIVIQVTGGSSSNSAQGTSSASYTSSASSSATSSAAASSSNTKSSGASVSAPVAWSVAALLGVVGAAATLL